MKAKHPLKRRFVSDEQAVKTASQHRKPCADCPFARTSLAGWLGAHTREEWVAMIHGEAWINCHCTTNQQCAGAAIFRANVIKCCRSPEHLSLPADTRLVFSNNAEFMTHHGRH